MVVPATLYEPLRIALQGLREDLKKQHGARCSITSTIKSFPAALPIVLNIDPAITHPQGYELLLSSKNISLRAQSAIGLHYGLLTLRQIVQQTHTDRLPCLRIHDAPAFEDRGIMLDISRCKVPTLATLKMFIQQCSSLKINQLQLYIEHTFAFAEHPGVSKDSSPITPEDVLELDAWCKAHFIELVPNFNSFGHWERWLKHPAYKEYANSPQGYTNIWGTAYPHGSMLKPNANSLRLLDQLYAEFLPQFTSGYFNVGCDETLELGNGWSKKICDKSGTEQVYLSFLRKIEKLCSKHQRRMMFWGDIIMKHAELIPELPANVVALEWGYEADHPFATDCKAFAESGIPFYVCPGTSSWNSITGRTQNALENLRSAAKHGKRQGAQGYLITDWGDNGHHQNLPISYLPFTAGSCLAWNPKNEPDFEAAANQVFFGDEHSAGLFAALGRTHDHFTTPFFNSSVYHHLLFHDKVPHEKLVNLKTNELKKALKKLTQLEAKHRSIKDPLIRREFRQAIGLATHAIHRGLILKAQPVPASRLVRLKKEHRALWLERNRSGGLRESLARFKK